jgi:HD-GYP domain-containing protein (c-di-GMP phosphodiesterase class II)
MLSEHHITGSFGVATFPLHGFSAEDIIRVADAGMYVSKRAGGDRVSTSEELDTDQTMSARQLVSGYVEGFLQRERTGPEQVGELVGTLRKLASSTEQKNLSLLRDSIEALARAAESRELNAAGHGEAVGQYCEMIGRALGLPPEETRELAFVGRVHDVGKIFIPERVLNHEGPVPEDEFHYLRMHPRVGAEILSALPNSERMQKAIAFHHERVDGSGYPEGLKGEDIPLWARILAVADAYVNLTTDHSLSPGKSREEAVAELEKQSGTKYDGMLVRVLARELKTERGLVI